MNFIPRSGGVYILVFHLSRMTSVTFDRKGSNHAFSPGWYLYVGSARGAGGLRGRLARHQRQKADSKRMHWNVDYFREHSMLCEIWYHETDNSSVEHHWAKAVASLIGTTVPVLKFGASDCPSQCPAHFFHLLKRPSTAVFRTKLNSQGTTEQLFVEFIETPHAEQSSFGIQSEYLLGRQVLERRTLSIRDSGLEPTQWNSLAKRKPARKLAERVAKETKVSYPTLERAIKFATAVETLIRNCGESAWSILFDPIRPQPGQAILKLSRTSDVRQRYRVNGVIEGIFRSVAPHSDDTVFDTVKFSEVLSRLARARGCLGKLLNLLRCPHESQIVEEAKRLCQLCRLSAKQLDDRLTNRTRSTAAVPNYLGKEIVMSKLRSNSVKGISIGEARKALRFSVKNVWDFEEMIRRGLEPTARQLQVARFEIKRIQEITRLIECHKAINRTVRTRYAG